VIRFAAAKNMVPLDLNQYGEGLVLNYTIDSNDGSPTQGDFIVSNGSNTGDPHLDPWRSTNYDLSVEWYLASASMLSAAVFKVDVDSFTETRSFDEAHPD